MQLSVARMENTIKTLSEWPPFWDPARDSKGADFEIVNYSEKKRGNKKRFATFQWRIYGGRYKTRIQDLACYIVLKYIKIALFASFDELFCPVLSLLLPTCVNLLRLKISKTFG